MSDIKAAREKLNNLVVSAELTLLSIVQGVALYFLTDSTRAAILAKQWQLLPYSAVGLLVICTVWSRAIMHAFTIVRWPIEFVHNFLYIAIALCESLIFQSIDAPARWFALSTAFMAIAWITYVHDLKMIDKAIALRRTEPERPASALAVYGEVRRDQILKIRVAIPAIFAIFGAMALFCNYFPDAALRDGGHFVCILIQFAVMLAYLIFNIRNFNRMTALILKSENELSRCERST
ncbi:MAG: hypothetical protein HY286_08850 [Planctomycetes bacterium]|nr:hypothetical protein [Planctomycetota bacterium]